MNKILMHMAISTVILFETTFTLQAQEIQSPNKRIELLERQLKERDKLLIELLERIETLENRVGVENTNNRANQEPDVETTTTTKLDSSVPGSVVVDYSMAERALERSLSHEGALLLPSGVFEIETGIVYARQEYSSASLIEGDNGLFVGQNNRNINQLATNIGVRIGLPAGSQLEMGIPYRLISLQNQLESGFSPVGTESSSANGFGDLRIGVAKTLLKEGLTRPDLIGRITWDSRTGSKHQNSLNLGSGFDEITGSLVALKRQDPIVFIGGVSYQYSFKYGEVKPGVLYGGNLGAAYALSPETSMRFAFSVGYQDNTRINNVSVSGSDRLLSSFIIGASTLLKPGVLMNMSLGIGLTKDTEDFSLSMSLPIRF